MLFGKKKVETKTTTNEIENKIKDIPEEEVVIDADKDSQDLDKSVKTTKTKDRPTNGQQTKTDEPAYSKYKGVDFNKFSKEKLFGVIVELILENKKIYQDNEKLKDELLESEKSTASVRKDMSKTGDIIELIAQKICPSIIEMENNGKKLTDDAKARIIIDNVLNEKKKLMTNILASREKLKEQKVVLDELRAQLAEHIEIHNKEALEEGKGYTEKEFEAIASTAIPETEEAKSIQGTIALKPIDLEKVRNNIGPTEKKILEGIGKEGISENLLLLEYCIKGNEGITESKYETAFENLKNSGVIEVDNVQSFNKPRGTKLVNLSSDIGKRLYREYFKAVPVLCEKEKIKKENDNLVHGYSIKDTFKQLSDSGYLELSMDRKENTIPISGANTWVPDIIGKNPITNRKECFEVEYGNHNQDNFSIKLDKANMKTSILRIIVPNKAVKDNILAKVRNWQASSKKTISMTIFIQTFLELKNKVDGIVITPQDKNIIKEVSDDIQNKNDNLKKPISKKIEPKKSEPIQSNIEEDV